MLAFHKVNRACKILQYVAFDFTIDPVFALAGVSLLGEMDDVDVTA